MDDFGVDRGVIGRGDGRGPVQRIKAEDDRRRDDGERDQPGQGRAMGYACGLHRYCPNQSSHARSPAQTPIAVQTNSRKGRRFATPDAKNPARAPIASRIPIRAHTIQAGKYEPAIVNEGAPRPAQPLKAIDIGNISKLRIYPVLACNRTFGLHCGDRVAPATSTNVSGADLVNSGLRERYIRRTTMLATSPEWVLQARGRPGPI